MSGYVRIHRSLIGHPAFRHDGEALAFAWMVIRAAWKPCRVRYKERTIALKRGQLAVSQRDMARALEKDKAWVARFWERLKNEAMIEAATEAGVAVITICNYNKFQPTKEAGEAGSEAQDEAGARQERGTEQGIEEREEEKEGSEANASGTVVPHPASDFCKAVFDAGVRLLTAAGKTEQAARALVGKWRRDLGDAELLTLIRQAEVEAYSDPAAWLTAAVARRSGKRLHSGGYVSASGYEYRSSDPEQVMREAEKRADWTTYYQAKSDMEGRNAAKG